MSEEILAPLAGKIVKSFLKVGDQVEEDAEVVIIEAMKMEMPIVTDDAGTVKAVNCKQGDAVEADAVLVVLE